MSQSLNVGFVGLGIMGAPMCGHLINAGHQVFVTTRSKVPESIAQTKAVICKTPQEVAENADIIITMVPDTPDVEKVLFGDHGIAKGISKGKVVVDMSSISPITTKEFAQKINALGAEYLDAPVSGGEVGAKNAALTIMVGGSEATFDRVKPLFELMGKNITLVGGNGDGQTAKVANQIIVALNIEAVSEALLFAAKAGADPANQIQLGWRLAFNRLPSTAERSDATAFLAAQASHLRAKAPPAEPAKPDPKAKPAPPPPTPEQQALTSLCQSLLGSNEFLYVD